MLFSYKQVLTEFFHELVMKYSIYYQARVQKELCWMVTATIRYLDHVAFDRTIDKENSIFEFYVAPDLEQEFLGVAQCLLERQVFLSLEKLSNRLMTEDISSSHPRECGDPSL